ncbi:enoyl-CoA hydratase/isomerase family protein [Mycolicibacterium mucogenicum]|uniref:Enoyl-CoA hydratase/isomerase family protein n=1 Tax=Mycolicibacterium mucogenicum DSM 44124 TaxID=1226753 RepID=A0A8H2PEG5_MYCMU|nr:enoyl-CoA hydratase/isomerase family protein [Mycolicibacterium mucogenicum]KAB7761364.1 enoyl-CoA hydratase [Mycolicibacterium mucogenicum DSM 44124]QPG70189.1 enoyl-CoA hydratase/isomerase family protein [Mycolicibacterium mucogenicum DSM 44124]
MTEPVLLDVAGRVATVTLNRPEQRNAITVALGAALDRSLREAASLADVVVVRGAGGNFCAGGDFHELGRLRADGRDAMAKLFDNFRRACAVIESLPIPVICAVEGYATAGGFELVQAADIVLLHENAVLADIHTKFGQIPGGGSTQRLPRLVGRQRALAHILTADKLTAAEALDWGLAYRVFGAGEFDSAVAGFATTLAMKDRTALERTKALVYRGLRLPLDDGLALEREAVLDHVALTGTGVGRG